MSKFILFTFTFLVLTGKLFSQTITASDVSRNGSYTTGGSMTATSVSGFNIDAAPWDFSKLTYTTNTGGGTVIISSSKFGSKCDGATELKEANVFSKSEFLVNGVKNIGYSFQKLTNDGLWSLGSCSDTNLFSTLPNNLTYKLPLSKGTKWTANYGYKTQYFELNNTIENEADLNGQATVPNGNGGKETMDCFRVKTKTISQTKGVGFSMTTTSYSYQWIAKNSGGVFVMATATADSNNVLNSVSVPLKPTEIKSVENETNSEFSLLNTVPNPAANIASLHFNLKNSGHGVISLFNSNGKLITVLQNKFFEAGEQFLNINVNDLESGLYFYTLNFNRVTAKKSFNVVK